MSESVYLFPDVHAALGIKISDLGCIMAEVEHIEVTEREGGLYDEICSKAPHLSGKIGRLKRELVGLVRGIEDESHWLDPRIRIAGPFGEFVVECWG